MRFLARHWSEILFSGMAILLGIAGLIIAIIGLNISNESDKTLKDTNDTLNLTSKTLQDVSTTQQERSKVLQDVNKTMPETNKTLQDVNKTMKETNETLRDVNTLLNTLETRTQNAEETSISIWYSWNLLSVTNIDFIKERQVQAAHTTPPYVEQLTSTEFKTTLEGRGLLTPEQIQKIIGLIEKDKNTSESQVILSLGIDKLNLQAKTHNVSIDVIIGVVASYTQEQKHKTP
ncbi:MAG: hypothetical protein HY528_04980 [Chloroflexi bacterium]|nr:hypothetical protein [Chloroflexota bacterium]